MSDIIEYLPRLECTGRYDVVTSIDKSGERPSQYHETCSTTMFGPSAMSFSKLVNVLRLNPVKWDL